MNGANIIENNEAARIIWNACEPMTCSSLARANITKLNSPACAKISPVLIPTPIS